MTEAKENAKLPYWQVNVPENQRPATCPQFLREIGTRNEEMISVPEDEFHRLTWPEVQELIKTNRIDLFRRAPADHRRYLAFSHQLKKEYGSVMDFVAQKRLKWTEMKPRAAPFEDPDDITILYNDWPYGIDEKIIHLVVWTKFELEDDKEKDDLTPRMRREIDEYVDKTFRSRIPPENIIWFKNWSSLKSIHAMEHFHVMLNDPDTDFIQEVTKGDVPAAEKGPQIMVSWNEFVAFDIIGNLTFEESLKCISSGNKEYISFRNVIFKAGKRINAFKYLPHLTPLMGPVLQRSKAFQQRMESFHNAAAMVVKRMATKTDRKDFISYALQAMEKSDPSTMMSNEEKKSSYEVLMVAGSETTATQLSGITYQLMKNLDILENLVTEIRSTFA
ncbi:hypothetical protein MMC28_008195 [Mycoblastus sanguinarius]|nr:hypothetical protein [Mycoblastus sanguinarius]